jgi:hypothetical protein
MIIAFSLFCYFRGFKFLGCFRVEGNVMYLKVAFVVEANLMGWNKAYGLEIKL